MVIRKLGQMQNSLFFQSKTFDAVSFALGGMYCAGGRGRFRRPRAYLILISQDETLLRKTRLDGSAKRFAPVGDRALSPEMIQFGSIFIIN
jgi:hypothetical protein